MSNGWEPRTRLGRKVVDGEITDMRAALNSGLPHVGYLALYDLVSEPRSRLPASVTHSSSSSRSSSKCSGSSVASNSPL